MIHNPKEIKEGEPIIVLTGLARKSRPYLARFSHFEPGSSTNWKGYHDSIHFTNPIKLREPLTYEGRLVANLDLTRHWLKERGQYSPRHLRCLATELEEVGEALSLIDDNSAEVYFDWIEALKKDQELGLLTPVELAIIKEGDRKFVLDKSKQRPDLSRAKLSKRLELWIGDDIETRQHIYEIN